MFTARVRASKSLRGISSRVAGVRAKPRRELRLESLEERCQLSGVPYMVADLRAGIGMSVPRDFVELNDVVYFVATNDGLTYELWRTNGTALGTERVAGISDGVGSLKAEPEFTQFGDRLYYVATHPESGTELWSTDGTAEGTKLVRDIWSGAANSSQPEDLVVADGLLYFIANDGVHGRELWKTDGTAAGTALVRDLLMGMPSDSSYPYELTAVGDRLYFTTSYATVGGAIWQTDGTAESTSVAIEVTPDADDANVDELFAVGSYLYFVADEQVNNRSVQDVLYRTDVTSGEVVRLSPTSPGHCAFEEMAVFQDTLYFACDEREDLWKTDGTVAGTTLVAHFTGTDDEPHPESLTPVGDRLYFVLTHDAGDVRLYVTDGSTAGTQVVQQFATKPTNLVGAGDQLYFTLDDGVHGGELWTSDGMAAGTRIVADIRPGTSGSAPAGLFYSDGRLYFSADDGVHGRELWVLPTTRSVAGDLNFDGVVNRGDLAVLASNFGISSSAAAEQGDLDGDGRIGVRDAKLLRSQIATPASAAESIIVARRQDVTSARGDRLEARRRGLPSRSVDSLSATDRVLAQSADVRSQLSAGGQQLGRGRR